MSRQKQQIVTTDSHEYSKQLSTLKAAVIRPPGTLVHHAYTESVDKLRLFRVEINSTDNPSIVVTVPDEWPHIILAPLYDVHLGSKHLDGEKLVRDLEWMVNEPYVLTWNGGDLWDNATQLSVASPFENNQTPNEQASTAQTLLQLLLPKMMFGLPGNHEARTMRSANFDVSRVLHENLNIPYSVDYMFCTIKWRGNKFRLLAHHGTGAAASAGGQRNAARKDLTWAHGIDMYWTGHLHQPLTDLMEIVHFDQKSDAPVSKAVYSVISPSYLKYFGGYSAIKRLAPGARGLISATLQADGRIDIENHANGKRL